MAGWTIHGEEVVYDDPHLRLVLLDVEAPNGDRFRHHVVHVRPVAVAAVVDEADRVLLVRRHRYVVDTWGWELPGGLVDRGETPAQAATREVVEETGWRPRSVRHLLSYHPMAGIVTAEQDIFLGTDPERVGPPTDPEEGAEVAWVPLSEVPALIARGEVIGAGSLVGLLQLLALGAR